ncbi:DUF3429 domain-containing protein [Erythrobacter sp. SDW2]|uniref:DUF3429 domain-containing protein n=1 Tax=Erythrobacter sp. SDW2 TaxID=2907154 RepID=UPI001F3EB265|nr:DUF3429 domain-containing protein [Erythrobacter sp. SDW2]UIP05960.1 DUF3429 domain-containing protein [Erythrobacter sp. SDW2]
MNDKTAERQSVPAAAQWLGYAGLLPQMIAILLVVQGGSLSWIALASSYAYAALIFSFLGGVWWGQALSHPGAPRWAFAVAVLPSLIGLALFLPWTFGSEWPGPSLLWLGLMLCLSPLVDRQLALGGKEWMTLRWRLSLGLGGLSVVLALLAMEQR